MLRGQNKKAESDLNKEYADSGYRVKCEFYDDVKSYEEGSAIIDSMASDKNITAVIGSVDMDINKTAAYVLNNNKKLFVVPFFLYDDVFEDNNYSMVFSLCNSAQTVGKILKLATAKTPAKRWAVCAADGNFEQAEMKSFLQCDAGDSIQIADCVSISALESKFGDIYDRWETLGVEGVVMFPEADEGFDILKKLKKRNPALICGGDTAFDDSTLTQNDKELMDAMNGFILVGEFMTNYDDEEETELFQKMKDEYLENTGEQTDLWYIQGYNAVRVIADTAIKNKTTDPERIAEILHSDGYDGLIEDFTFNEKGEQKTQRYTYVVFDENGYTKAYDID